MRKSHKLLAVVMWLGSTQAYAETPLTLANGAPAAGNTIAKGKPQSQASKLKAARAGLAQAKKRMELAVQEELALVQVFVTTPRVHASGAPACGNTMGKGEEPCTEARAKQEQLERFANMQNAITQTRLAKERVQDATRYVEELRRSLDEDTVASADVG